MEKIMEDLSILSDYRNRQVVLNYYRDEDYLWKRDGFHTDIIELTNDHLVFKKGNGSSIQILLNEYPIRVMNNQFPDYYILRNGTNRLEIYFPH